jgi:hypothetical protein
MAIDDKQAALSSCSPLSAAEQHDLQQQMSPVKGLQKPTLEIAGTKHSLEASVIFATAGPPQSPVQPGLPDDHSSSHTERVGKASAASPAAPANANSTWLDAQLELLYSNELLQATKQQAPQQVLNSWTCITAGVTDEGSIKGGGYSLRDTLDVNMLAAGEAAATAAAAGAAAGAESCQSSVAIASQAVQGLTASQLHQQQQEQHALLEGSGLSGQSTQPCSSIQFSGSPLMPAPAEPISEQQEAPATANMSAAVDAARQLPAQMMPAVQAAADEDSGCLGTTASSGGVTGCAVDPVLVNCSSLTSHTPSTAELAACWDISSSGSSRITGANAVSNKPDAAAAAEALLCAGNADYRCGNYHTAAASYTAAIERLGGTTCGMLPQQAVIEPNLMLLWMKCSLNLACCRLRQGNYRQCLAECDALKEGESAGSTSGSGCHGWQPAPGCHDDVDMTMDMSWQGLKMMSYLLHMLLLCLHHVPIACCCCDRETAADHPFHHCCCAAP